MSCLLDHLVFSFELFLLLLDLQLGVSHIWMLFVEFHDDSVPGFRGPPVLTLVFRGIVLMEQINKSLLQLKIPGGSSCLRIISKLATD